MNSNNIYFEHNRPYSGKQQKKNIAGIIYALFLFLTLTTCTDDPKEIRVSGVTLSQTVASLTVGGTLPLTATVQPDEADNKKVNWTSSNINVATVSSTGLVAAISAGTANITATTEDGNRTATCSVTVTEITITVTGVMLDKNEITMDEGASETLNVTVSPDNAANKNVTWSSSNTAIATVDATGKVTAKAAGTATIIVTTQDGNKTATCKVTVNLSKPNVITMTTAKSGEVSITLGGANTAIIDWGDGSLPETVSISTSKSFTHNYLSSASRKIGITGDKIRLLYCFGIQLTSLEVSGCSNLSDLYCQNNQLTSLDLSGCTALNTLYCGYNPMKKLDCRNLSLKTLSVWACENLTTLGCDNNQINSLLLGRCFSLTELNCSNNQLEELGMRDCASLTELNCSDNMLSDLNVTGNNNLKIIKYERNLLNINAINTVFSEIPWGKSGYYEIFTDGNGPGKDGTGTNGCDRSIAENKGWTVYPLKGSQIVVSGITLNKTTLSLPIGVSETLIPTIQPANASNKGMTWTSSNPAVAAVSNTGCVTAKSAGSATITASTMDGNKSASCVVTVATSQLKDGSWYAVQTHKAGKGSDLVFMGDGYTATDIAQGKYEADMRLAIEGFFEIQPYKAYRNYFNVYIVGAVSAESGIGTGSPKNTKFQTHYNYQKLVTNYTNLCYEYAQKAPIRHIDSAAVVVISNMDNTEFANFGIGVCYQSLSGRTVSLSVNGMYIKEIVTHEAGGHGFAKLADEYVEAIEAAFLSRNDIPGYHKIGWYQNVDITGDPAKVVWKDFIGKSKYRMVSAFEGGYYFPTGVWRPEENSCMLNPLRSWYFNAPSRAAIVRRIKAQAGEPFTMDWFMSTDIIEPYIEKRSAAELHSLPPIQHAPPIILP